MRMLELGNSLCLALEQLNRLGAIVLRQITRNRLDGDGSVQPLVTRRPHIRHTATPDMLDHLIMRKLTGNIHEMFLCGILVPILIIESGDACNKRGMERRSIVITNVTEKGMVMAKGY